MQYLAALLWIMFLYASINEAYKVHCVRGGLAEMIRRFGRVQKGMAKREVKAILGSPDKLRYDSKRLKWQYLVGEEYFSIEFYKGQVINVDAPSEQLSQSKTAIA